MKKITRKKIIRILCGICELNFSSIRAPKELIKGEVARDFLATHFSKPAPPRTALGDDFDLFRFYKEIQKSPGRVRQQNLPKIQYCPYQR
jgi:hypothetical protein